MNETLIANYNAVVGTNDTVYILGDLAYKINASAIPGLLRRMNGKKILIHGNHDKRSCDELYEYSKDFDRVTLDGVDISLMHYPMLTWPGRCRGAIHVHGHIHADVTYNETNRDMGIRRYDVGVDANNFFPVSLEQIKSFFSLGIPESQLNLRDWMDERL